MSTAPPSKSKESKEPLLTCQQRPLPSQKHQKSPFIHVNAKKARVQVCKKSKKLRFIPQKSFITHNTKKSPTMQVKRGLPYVLKNHHRREHCCTEHMGGGAPTKISVTNIHTTDTDTDTHTHTPTPHTHYTQSYTTARAHILSYALHMCCCVSYVNHICVTYMRCNIATCVGHVCVVKCVCHLCVTYVLHYVLPYETYAGHMCCEMCLCYICVCVTYVLHMCCIM